MVECSVPLRIPSFEGTCLGAGKAGMTCPLRRYTDPGQPQSDQIRRRGARLETAGDVLPVDEHCPAEAIGMCRPHDEDAGAVGGGSARDCVPSSPIAVGGSLGGPVRGRLTLEEEFLQDVPGQRPTARGEGVPSNPSGKGADDARATKRPIGLLVRCRPGHLSG